MRESTRQRSVAKLSQAVHHQLNLYAFGAAAAGVGLMARAQPVEAKIVYTPANITISGKTILDLNHDGITDFTFRTSYFNSTSYFLQDLRVAPYGTNQILGENRFPRALRAGVRIGGAQHFSQLSTFMARVSFNSRNGHSRFKGEWANGGKGVKNRYLGLKFFINGKVRYGWARLTVTITSSHQPQGKLTGYAYETIPNKAIVAGKTKGPDVITLQSPSLGHLARGASSISAWRVRETVASAH